LPVPLHNARAILNTMTDVRRAVTVLRHGVAHNMRRGACSNPSKRRKKHSGPNMSQLALDLLEVRRYPRGALVEHLLRAFALNLIAPGVAPEGSWL
jgi:hypothetical protein